MPTRIIIPIKWFSAFCLSYGIDFSIEFSEVCHGLFFDDHRIELPLVRIGFDVGAVGKQDFSVNESIVYALSDDVVEYFSNEFRTFDKSKPSCLAEGGMIRDLVIQVIADEPSVSKIDFDFLDQSTLAADAEEVSDEEHFKERNRMNGGTTIVMAVEIVCQIFNETKVDVTVYFAKQMVFGNIIFQADHLEGVLGRFVFYHR